MTVSAEGHSPNDTGQCKVRNTDLALISSVELVCLLEYVMCGRTGKRCGAACRGLS